MRYNRGAFNYRTCLNLEQFTIAEKQHFLLNVFVESLNKGCSTMMGQKGGCRCMLVWESSGQGYLAAY
jgi:hypothetical protein